MECCLSGAFRVRCLFGGVRRDDPTPCRGDSSFVRMTGRMTSAPTIPLVSVPMDGSAELATVPVRAQCWEHFVGVAWSIYCQANRQTANLKVSANRTSLRRDSKVPVLGRILAFGEALRSFLRLGGGFRFAGLRPQCIAPLVDFLQNLGQHRAAADLPVGERLVEHALAGCRRGLVALFGQPAGELLRVPPVGDVAERLGGGVRPFRQRLREQRRGRIRLTRFDVDQQLVRIVTGAVSELRRE